MNELIRILGKCDIGHKKRIYVFWRMQNVNFALQGRLF